MVTPLVTAQPTTVSPNRLSPNRCVRYISARVKASKGWRPVRNPAWSGQVRHSQNRLHQVLQPCTLTTMTTMTTMTLTSSTSHHDQASTQPHPAPPHHLTIHHPTPPHHPTPSPPSNPTPPTTKAMTLTTLTTYDHTVQAFCTAMHVPLCASIFMPRTKLPFRTTRFRSCSRCLPHGA
jgi:hypothetical protein